MGSMNTKEIIEVIKDKGCYIGCFEDLLENEILSEDVYNKLEVQKWENTNPRREYLGTRYYVLNKEDGCYFAVEIYGDEMGTELYTCEPVNKVSETKEVISFVPTNG